VAPPPMPSGLTRLVFSQADVTLDGVTVVNSSWGSVDVTFTGSSTIQYFNLSVNDAWQVQNLPIVSTEGSGVTQTQTVNFPLGTPDGVLVQSIRFGSAWTSSVLSSPPPSVNSAFVARRTVAMFTAEEGETLPYTQPLPVIGGPVAPVATARQVARVPQVGVNSGVPNQEVGVNECVPGAISNSLQFLKNQGLKLNDADITIDKMKDATCWTADGAPVAPTPWWEKKDMYMQANGLPVTTTTTMSFADAINALNKHCDVELRVPGHAAVVTGVVALANGDYGIIVQHDTNQGAAGGTRSEVVIYRASDGTLWDGTWINGKPFDRFVIECPKT
jgi:hypothetical protein